MPKTSRHARRPAPAEAASLRIRKAAGCIDLLCAAGGRRWAWRLRDVPPAMISSCPEDGDAAWTWLWEQAPWSMSVLIQAAWLELLGVCPRNIILSSREPSEFPPRPFPPCAVLIDLMEEGSFACSYTALARRHGLFAARKLLAESAIAANIEEALRRQRGLPPEPEPSPPAA